jgi:tetrahydromethanopterin S-methyltransferase subunit G
MLEQKMSSSRKITNCLECQQTFWYIDPRIGGRPRQKCGICSSRPPRYPWGFVDPDQPNWEQEGVFVPDLGHIGGASEQLSSDENLLTPTIHAQNSSNSELVTPTNELSLDACPIPSSYANSITGEDMPNISEHERELSTRHHRNPQHTEDMRYIEQQLDDISRRLAELEKKVDTVRSQVVLRSDWIDLSARLDMVEHNMSETLGKVRTRLDNFSKEVKQIAVVPEKELGEMFELIRMIRRYLDNS